MLVINLLPDKGNININYQWVLDRRDGGFTGGSRRVGSRKSSCWWLIWSTCLFTGIGSVVRSASRTGSLSGGCSPRALSPQSPPHYWCCSWVYAPDERPLSWPLVSHPIDFPPLWRSYPLNPDWHSCPPFRTFILSYPVLSRCWTSFSTEF